MSERILLIGAGVIADTHRNAVRTHSPDAEVHVCDLDPARCERMRAADPAVVVHEDHRTMLAQPPEPDDIVIVCTPPSTHATLSIDALRSGRHVLCEKPFATSVADARAMRAAARAAGRRIGCCSVRFNAQDPVRRLRQGLAEGRCGDLYRIAWHALNPRARTGIEHQPGSYWFLTRAANGGGALMDWAPYDLMVLLDVLDARTVEIAQAWTAQPWTALPEDCDPTSVDVEFHGGASLLVTTAEGARVGVDFERSSCCHGRQRNRFDCYGVDGGARLGWIPWEAGEDRLLWFADHDGVCVEERIACTPANAEPSIMHVPYLHFRAAIADNAPHAGVDAHAVFACEVLLGIYRVAETGTAHTCTLDTETGP